MIVLGSSSIENSTRLELLVLLEAVVLTKINFSVAVLSILVSICSFWYAFKSLPEDGVFVEPKIVDLGKVRQGSEHSVEFRLKNNKNHGIAIKDVRTSCGCSTVGYEPESIKARTANQFQLLWEIGARRGHTSITAVFRYQDLKTGLFDETVAHVTADVLPTFLIKPNVLVFSPVRKGPMEVIVNRGPGWHSGEVINAETTHRAIRAELHECDEETGQTSILVHFDPNRWQSNYDRETKVILLTTAQYEEELMIPVAIDGEGS